MQNPKTLISLSNVDISTNCYCNPQNQEEETKERPDVYFGAEAATAASSTAATGLHTSLWVFQSSFCISAKQN
jgi:hypothetical protein